MRVLKNKVFFLYNSLLVVIVSGLSHSECIKSEQTDCPTWKYYQDSSNSCVCNNHVGGAIDCFEESPEYYCIFFSENLNSTLIGSCPYGQPATLPKNASEIKDYFRQCSNLHRKGPLCGECEDNYSLPVYSYNLGCVKC